LNGEVCSWANQQYIHAENTTKGIHHTFLLEHALQIPTCYSAATKPATNMPMPSPSALCRTAAPGDVVAAAADDDAAEAALELVVVVVCAPVAVVVVVPLVVVEPLVAAVPVDVDAVPVDEEAVEADAGHVAVWGRSFTFWPAHRALANLRVAVGYELAGEAMPKSVPRTFLVGLVARLGDATSHVGNVGGVAADTPDVQLSTAAISRNAVEGASRYAWVVGC